MKDNDGQVIQYIDGFAWGVLPDGRTICLGRETEIKTIIANPKMCPRNPTIASVVSLERQLIKKEEEKETKEQTKATEKKKARISRLRA